jgi:hypothetical protein
MVDKQKDLLVGVAFSIMTIGLAAFNYYPPLLRVVLALLFVLFLPGYALTAAFFPQQPISGLEKFLYSIGLSLGTAIIGGLALNFTPWGLKASSWGYLLSTVTLAASLAAILRRNKAPGNAPATSRLHLSLQQGVMFGLTGLIMVVAIGFARQPVPLPDIRGYTTLWMLPVAQSQPNAVQLGIHSQEFVSTQYELLLTLNGKLLQGWSSISLLPGDQWEQTVTLPAGQGRLSAVLIRTDNPGTVYRYVTRTVYPVGK